VHQLAFELARFKLDRRLERGEPDSLGLDREPPGVVHPVKRLIVGEAGRGARGRCPWAARYRETPLGGQLHLQRGIGEAHALHKQSSERERLGVAGGHVWRTRTALLIEVARSLVGPGAPHPDLTFRVIS
jgi:hypothetical protein